VLKKLLYIVLILVSALSSIALAQNTYEIRIGVNGHHYSPRVTNCSIGDTIKFIWVSGANPTRSDDGQSIPTFNLNAANTVRTFVMTSAGSIPFYSTTHGDQNGSGMAGIINVSGLSASLANKSLVSTLSVFPNPANDKINVNFVVKKESNVVIRLLDVLGNDVSVLVNDKYSVGEYRQSFAVPSRVTKGLYFVKVSVGTEVAIKRISIQ
jgi:plastocyanin